MCFDITFCTGSGRRTHALQIAKNLFTCRRLPGKKEKTFSAPEKYEKKMGGKKKIVPTPTQKNGACAENITQ
jgi:hypothetical protein